MTENTDRYATIGAAFLSKVAQRLSQIKVEELSPNDLARWTDVALKLQQAGSHSRYDRQARLSAMTQPGLDEHPETSQRALLDEEGIDTTTIGMSDARTGRPIDETEQKNRKRRK